MTFPDEKISEKSGNDNYFFQQYFTMQIDTYHRPNIHPW